jgi:hypothetical protein
MASGKSLDLNGIKKPEPEVVHRHVGAPRAVRRKKKNLLAWKGSFLTNEPYINRDKVRRLIRKKEEK